MAKNIDFLFDAGFELGERNGHGSVADGNATCFLTLIDYSADRMVEMGLLCAQTAQALKADAKERVEANRFFGFMSNVGQIARKPLL